MSNYLVSLRKEAEGSTDGTPGPELGDTTYISFEDTAEDYRLIGDDVVADGEEWAGMVKEAAGGGPVIVFVHGYNNASSHVVETQLSLTNQLSAPTAFGDEPHCLVSFDWPTYHAGTTYHKDHDNAVSSAPRLLPDCLSLLIDAVGSANVHLFGHSMGSYVTQLAFQDPAQWAISHVLLAAADVAASDFETGSPQLTAFLKHCADLTCYWSEYDQALATSETLHHDKRLGKRGFSVETTDAEEQCVDLACSAYYDQHIGTSSAQGSHTWYLTNADFIEDLSRVVGDASVFRTRQPDSAAHKDRFELKKP